MMGANSGIEWTDHTFNPWMGCTKVSPGCANCYAEREMKRFGADGHWGKDAPRKVTSEAYWKKPVFWNGSQWVECAGCGWRGPKKKLRAGFQCGACYQTNLAPIRQRVFCGSMCDIFEEREDLEDKRRWLWELIEATPNLDWLLLTKRPKNVKDMVPAAWLMDASWPDNVWIGTNVEDQQRADERIPELLEIPARVLFLSCEPLLGPVNLRSIAYTLPEGAVVLAGYNGPAKIDALRGYDDNEWHTKIDWVIAGGESGISIFTRPCESEWVRSLRNQCKDAGIPFFLSNGALGSLLTRRPLPAFVS